MPRSTQLVSTKKNKNRGFVTKRKSPRTTASSDHPSFSYTRRRSDVSSNAPWHTFNQHPSDRLARMPTPDGQVTRFSNGVQEWCGETAKGGRFIVPFTPSPFARPSNTSNTNNHEAPTLRPKLVPEGVGPGFPLRQDVGTCVDMLDLKRVEAALAILQEEEDIADAMSGKPPRDRRGHRQLSTKRDGSQGRFVDAAVVDTPAGGLDGRTQSSSSAAGSVGPGGVNETREAQSVAAGRAATAGTGKAMRAAAVGVTSKGRRMRDVMAVYRHRGAQLVLEQSRKRHPFRMEGVFCRQDRGEWAGQVITNMPQDTWRKCNSHSRVTQADKRAFQSKSQYCTIKSKLFASWQKLPLPDTR